MPSRTRPYQGAYYVMQAQARSVTKTARALGVDPTHLRDALYGRVRPSHELRERLPRFLSVDVHELWDDDHLVEPFVRRDRQAVTTA